MALVSAFLWAVYLTGLVVGNHLCCAVVHGSAIEFAESRGPKTAEATRLLSAAKLIRRLRSVISTDNWEWVGGVLEDARAMRDLLPVCSLKELQVRDVACVCAVLVHVRASTH